ncbi:endonuclease/exonuclease/phosphatase family protein [Pseudohaliea sp.]|uniref:endonuclease/exonuclease/phosphatase family protein n=1 Tax=Pseudohaliea sp. TaxID=2740289 RepID=UPI0032EC8156
MQCRYSRPVTAALLLSLLAPPVAAESLTVRVATFNASMEGGNYVARGETPTGGEMAAALAGGDHPQVRNVAAIIRRVRPDILLINEFDYTADPGGAIDAFRTGYLEAPRADLEPVAYPYAFAAPVNTGVDSGFDLDRDGVASGRGQDAWGYGLYPGQYGMLLLSRYPIDRANARTFQHLRWRAMPGNLLAGLRAPDGSPWYPAEARARFPLSSKSHWDVPVVVDGATVHILASHPTPPVFDGPEDRNGRRNHDEIRFWTEYLSAAEDENWIRDDAGGTGGFRGERFVLLGDLNSSPVEGDSRRDAIRALLAHPAVNAGLVPTGAGGKAARPGNAHAPAHTAAWGQRADYVLPSRAGWKVIGGGVFWPAPGEPGAALVADRAASSDHRLVWLDLELQDR